jgi:hypothetical protein
MIELVYEVFILYVRENIVLDIYVCFVVFDRLLCQDMLAINTAVKRAF